MEARAIVIVVVASQYNNHHTTIAHRHYHCFTGIERAKLIAGYLRIMHALEEGGHAGVILAPEVVGDCDTIHVNITLRCIVLSIRQGEHKKSYRRAQPSAVDRW